ncbi:eukaryotic translation initiation factor 3 subunit J like protein [Zymoseptoria brevis]|uniref:Eukaryotic translation initiation factor 3 subunit J n=1 Tax=Zymoseptoria brevis TaxID=1047168 RepID=A0A0F4GJB6_9PEZI|nr:eukaryotic translation initiation factor 3 subunit J like protein [Zymoseptoria brevis]
MAPPSAWDDEDSDSSASSSAPAVVVRRGKFDDEEDGGEVLDSWDAAEDSEVEREKAKKAAEAKAKADALAKANAKSKSQRIEEKREERLRQKALEDLDGDSDEDEATKRARARDAELQGDLQHAEDLFGGVGGVPASRGAKPITVQDSDDPANAIDLSSLSLFNPTTAHGFLKLRETLSPLLNNNAKKPQYEMFMKEFSKQIVKEMNSEQIKKIASGLTALSNEKLKEEKAAEKGGKKTKAAKTKTSLNANRNISASADTGAYDDGLDEDDFM